MRVTGTVTGADDNVSSTKYFDLNDLIRVNHLGEKYDTDDKKSNTWFYNNISYVDSFGHLANSKTFTTAVDHFLKIGDKVDIIFKETGQIIRQGAIVEEIIDSKPENECRITLRAYVNKYKEERDYNFTLSAKLNNKPTVYEGDKLSISGQVSQPAYINVLGWYPDSDKDTYYKVFPNQFEKNNSVKNFFYIPRKDVLNKYELRTKIPDNVKEDETYEFFVIIASKKQFIILDNEKVLDFKKRLSILGRSNWDMKKIGYTIIRN